MANKKIRVGILTFHRSHNYGAVLQTFASQVALKRLGYTTEVIDYIPHSKIKAYEPKCKLPKRNPFRAIKSIIRYFLQIKRYRIRYDSFNEFVSSHLILSENYSDQFPAYIDSYDVIYIGSDQVWRRHNAAEGYDYYWGNINVPNDTKLVAYATSMETKKISDDEIELCKQNLSNFNSISVRETTLATILQPLVNKKIDVTLDPTLLLYKKDYIDIMSERVISCDYVLIYEMEHNPLVDVMAERIAKYHNLSIVKIVIPLIGPIYKTQKSQRFVTPSPTEFIRLFNDAKYILTNSFHGVAFSLLFEKPFFAFENEGRTTRIESLLSILEIKDAAYIKDYHMDISIDTDTLDYIEINKKLLELRNQSLDFIEKSCNSENRLIESV